MCGLYNCHTTIVQPRKELHVQVACVKRLGKKLQAVQLDVNCCTTDISRSYNRSAREFWPENLSGYFS
jgi:hypothetical protein